MLAPACKPRALLLSAFAVLLAGCGSDERSTSAPPADDRPEVADPGPVHVHGLGVNPRDGALFVATHTGLFRAPRGQTKARRVAGRFQDTMGFTVVGPDVFLGSGHPDGREGLPPFLGLIRSRDAGRTWKPISLLGKRDFHVLEAAGARIYGFGSDFQTREQGFLVSEDGGRRWQQRRVPEPIISLAVRPGDPDRLVASGERGLYVSEQAGRRWRAIEGPAGVVAWTDRLVVVDAEGEVLTAGNVGRRLRAVGEVGGQPAALDGGPHGDLYVALHDGEIKRSTDGGRTWRLRSKP